MKILCLKCNKNCTLYEEFDFFGVKVTGGGGVVGGVPFSTIHKKNLIQNDGLNPYR